MIQDKNSKYKAARILVVDDDPQIVKIVRKSLEREGYSTVEATSGTMALQSISQKDPDMVLLDVNMPGLNGLETLEVIRKHESYISTIFISGESKQESVILGLDAGADDYITKPFDILELLARVRTQLRVKALRDELRRAKEKLQRLVEIDDLTGLYNMRHLYEKLDGEIHRALRYDRQVAVVMMDLDRFKRVNDEHDHLFGSFVIAEVGKMISQNIRKVDFAARYGGDEYLVVLTETDKVGALNFAERLRKNIEDHKFTHEGASIKVTSSMGLAITNPNQENINARELVLFADKCLYKSKKTGRNRVSYEDFSTRESIAAPIDPRQLRSNK